MRRRGIHHPPSAADDSCMTVRCHSSELQGQQPVLDAGPALTAIDCDSTTGNEATLALLPTPSDDDKKKRKQHACNKRSPDTSSDSVTSDSIEAAYVHRHASGDDDSSRCKSRRRRSRKSIQLGGEEQQQQGLQEQVDADMKEEEDMANCLVMLSYDTMRPPPPVPSCASASDDQCVSSDKKEHKYSCATCKRVFKSHQALGGHRASHKRVKGCFARTSSSSTTTTTNTTFVSSLDEDDDHEEGENACEPPPQRMSGAGGTAKKMVTPPGNHECTVCHRVFPTGQALGGHKRCHWGGAGAAAGAASASEALARPLPPPLLPRLPQTLVTYTAAPPPRTLFDLNLPPCQEDYTVIQETSAASCDTAMASNITNNNNNTNTNTSNNTRIL